MTNTQIKNYLDKKLQDGSDLEKAVAQSILDSGYENLTDYMQDVLNNGCVSGTVSELIYYKDTHAFFVKYYKDIFHILEDIRENCGEEFSNYNGDRANTLAWLGYEETVRKFYDELEEQK